MIDAKTVKEVATKYIYDRCPAVVGVGKTYVFVLLCHLFIKGQLRKQILTLLSVLFQ